MTPNPIENQRKALGSISAHTGPGVAIGAAMGLFFVLQTQPEINFGLIAWSWTLTTLVCWGVTYAWAYSQWGLDAKLSKLEKIKNIQNLNKLEYRALRNSVIDEHCTLRSVIPTRSVTREVSKLVEKQVQERLESHIEKFENELLNLRRQIVENEANQDLERSAIIASVKDILIEVQNQTEKQVVGFVQQLVNETIDKTFVPEIQNRIEQLSDGKGKLRVDAPNGSPSDADNAPHERNLRDDAEVNDD